MRRGTITLFCALVALTAACSSSGSGRSELSKEDFLKQGNAICDAGNVRLDAALANAFPNATEQPSNEELTTFLNETFLPEIRRQIDELDQLTPPSELQSQVDEFLSNARSTIEGVAAQANSDPESVFAGTNDPFVSVSSDAAALGLTSCGGDTDDDGTSDDPST